MTDDIREEFARIAESRRKSPISASNIGYNCAIDEMVADLRALPSVYGGEEVRQPLNGDGDTLSSLADEIAAAESRSIMGMPVVPITLSAANRDHIVTALRAPGPSSESIRNAIAAMERIAQFGDVVRVNDDGTEQPAHKVIYTIEGHRACREIAATALAALKREVGEP